MPRRLFLIAGVALAAALPATPAAPAAASTIVYECQGNICAMEPDGSNHRKLTRDGDYGSGHYEFPRLSSDGRVLTFAFNNVGYTANRRARNRRQVRGPSSSGWPLAPVLRTGSREAFFFHGLLGQGANVLRLCRTRELPRSRPRCGPTLPSPSGRAYWGWGPGRTILSVDADDRKDLCVTDLAGRCRRAIVRLRRGTFFRGPALSPDGRTIAVPVEIGGEGFRIVLYDGRTGRHRRTLTRGHGDTDPVWSPNGRSLAFVRDAVVEGGVRSSICTVRARGGKVRCPLRRRLDISSPGWGG